LDLKTISDIEFMELLKKFVKKIYERIGEKKIKCVEKIELSEKKKGKKCNIF